MFISARNAAERTARITLAVVLALATFTVETAAQTARPAFAQYAEVQASIVSDFVMSGVPAQLKMEDGSIARLVGATDGMPLYYATQSTAASTSILADRLWPAAQQGFALTGSGQVVGVWDGGTPLTTHDEFTFAGPSRIVLKDNATFRDFQHATNVAGLAAGAGVNSAARGPAYRATVWAYDWTNDLFEMETAAQAGMNVSNHSYGAVLGWGGSLTQDGVTAPIWNGDTGVSDTEDYRFGHYGFLANMWDDLAANNPYYLPVKAAGNDRGRGKPAGTQHYTYSWSEGYVLSTDARDLDGGASGYDSIIGDGSVSKNVLTIGSVRALTSTYGGAQDVDVMSYSGWGPTDDGRIKPDLVAPGAGVTYPNSSANDGYSSTNNGGTSYASPVAAGAIALLHEHNETLGAAPLRASTVRALLYHSAREAGTTGPDYQHGYGLLNVEGAAYVMSENSISNGENIRELTLTNGSTQSFTVESNGTLPLRLTIAWTDPAAPAGMPALDDTTIRLVNDLDVRIAGPGGTFLPWTLDPANPSAPAVPGDNVRDNAEQIVVNAPAAGTYTVTISHKSSLSGGSQIVSAVVTGIVNPGLNADQDNDGILSIFEDLNGDGYAFNDDTDRDGTPNYLDSDDDGDFTPTADECADPNGDGNPADACMANGQPRYLFAGTLPVELTAFTASAAGLTAELAWTTATESNNAGFSVERLDDGVESSWIELSFIEGAGTTDVEQAYRFTTGELAPGVYSFRIRQIDFDGTETLSDVLEVRIAIPGAFSVTEVYPNPFSSSASLHVSVNTDENVHVRAYDVSGRLVSTLFDGAIRAGQTIDVTFIAPTQAADGVYLIAVTGESFSETRKVVLVR
ncbi:MAG: S8 family serine peptidase [Bacteroidota bacterium]